MSRAILIAELATSHGGNLAVAEDMIRAAADSGADYAKIQTYTLAKLNPKDPQYDWLVQSHLNQAAHERLMRVCEQAGIKFLSTPCDGVALEMLSGLGVRTIKIASSEAGARWWTLLPAASQTQWFVSWPWGRRDPVWGESAVPLYLTHLTAIPLYPTPLECVTTAALLDGWSDHCQGIVACQRALALGAKVIEAHFTLPGISRQMPFDKDPAQVRQLRDFAEACATMITGVSETFRNRWSA